MCNLSGYSGRNTANIHIIKLLAVFGRRRGTDGFGCWMGRTLTKFGGYNGEGDSLKIIEGMKVNIMRSSPKTILMHNRAKSVGAVNKENAHPYRYDYIDGKDYVFAHNGTIKNIDDLCKKYEIEPTVGFTDSYYLGKIIYENGFDVLKEYEGFAALTVLDVNTDILYIWKGFSQCESNVATEERPLHMYQKEGSLYYSSEEITLVTALNSDKNIYCVPDNVLLEVQNGEIINSTEYNRDHIKYVAPVYNYHNAYNNYPNYNNSTPTNVVKMFDYCKNPEPCPQNESGSKLYCWKGKYWRSGHLINGIYFINNDTLICTYAVDREIANFEKLTFSEKSQLSYKLHYFYRGYIIKDRELYDELVKENKNPDDYNSYDFAKKLLMDTVYFVKLSQSRYSLYFNNYYRDKEYVTPLYSKYVYKTDMGELLWDTVENQLRLKEEHNAQYTKYYNDEDDDSLCLDALPLKKYPTLNADLFSKHSF